MGFFSKFEDKMEDTVEGAASRMSKAPISPVQIAKKAEKQMRRQTMVGAGKEYAPTLYTVLVNPDDDARLFGYYPTLAGEIETYLKAKASQEGLVMDGNPLVRFIEDTKLRHGKFDIIAELVAAPTVEQLREVEMRRYGIAQQPAGNRAAQRSGRPSRQRPQQSAYPQGYDDQYDTGFDDAPYVPQRKPPLPYVPEDEIDRSIDYGEYTFNSEDFEDYRDGGVGDAPVAYNDTPAVQQPNTVAFAQDGAGAAPATPNHRTVRARLINLANQRPYDLGSATITLGRESSNSIPVHDANASRRHAQLSMNQQGLWIVTDLNSLNGTKVNGVSVASQPLYPGDVITIGKTDFEFALV